MPEYKFFTIYDPVTGKVIRSGSCPDTDLTIQVNDDQTESLLADVAADPRIHSIDVETKQLVDTPVVRGRGTPDIPQDAAVPSNPIKDLLERVTTLEAQMAQLLGDQVSKKG